MPERLTTSGTGHPARVNLKTYAAEQTRSYLLELIRQMVNLTYTVQKDSRRPKAPEHSAWKRQLLELLQA